MKYLARADMSNASHFLKIYACCFVSYSFYFMLRLRLKACMLLLFCSLFSFFSFSLLSTLFLYSLLSSLSFLLTLLVSRSCSSTLYNIRFTIHQQRNVHRLYRTTNLYLSINCFSCLGMANFLH